jgi:hypothetical protein
LAKAQFHRHQRVWVEAVGAWATIDRLIPVWSKGFDEPVRITYDVGLGREFTANELKADAPTEGALNGAGGAWRILRARNKWQEPEDCGHHPLPGTFPVVVTDPEDWGGWRVPGAEYDRAPYKIEHQARLIACAPQLLGLAQELLALATEAPDDVSPEVLRLARSARTLLRYISDAQTSPGGGDATQPHAPRAKQARTA